jgi:hypothetical protein
MLTSPPPPSPRHRIESFDSRTGRLLSRQLSGDADARVRIRDNTKVGEWLYVGRALYGDLSPFAQRATCPRVALGRARGAAGAQAAARRPAGAAGLFAKPSFSPDVKQAIVLFRSILVCVCVCARAQVCGFMRTRVCACARARAYLCVCV